MSTRAKVCGAPTHVEYVCASTAHDQVILLDVVPTIATLVLRDPRSSAGVAAPPSPARLRELYGTEQPTRAMLDGHELFEEIERGQCIYVIAYDGGKPSEIFFAGYSYD